MRRYTGKRYKKIFAGILAAALVVNSVPVTVRAGEMDADRSYTQLVDQSADNEETGDARLDEDTTADTASLWTNEDTSEDTQADTDQTTDEASVSTEDNESTEKTTEDTESADVTSEEAETTDASAIDTENAQTGDIPDAESGDDIDVQSAADEAAVYAAEETDGTLNLSDLGERSDIKINDDSIVVTSDDAMILLSNCKASELQNKKISISISGTADIIKEVILNGVSYTYHKIGTTANPFQGSLSGNVSLIAGHTMFGTVSSKADISLTGGLTWAGTAGETIFADTFIYETSVDYIFPLSRISMADNAVVGALMGTIKAADGVAAGTMNIGNVITYGSATVTVAGSENAGLICNTLAAGNIYLNGYTFPTAYTVTAGTGKGNAGGIIGEMAEHTGLTINSGSVQTITSLKVTASAGMAGGLVGYMPEGTSLTFSGNGGIMLKGDATANGDSISIKGQSRAGGIAGEAKNITLDHDGSATFTITTATIETTSEQDTGTGGLFGIYEISTNQDFGDWLHVGVTGTDITDAERVMVKPKWTKPGNDKITNVKKALETNTYAGGMFGALHICNGATVTITSDYLNVRKSRAFYNTSYGSIAGFVDSNSGAKNTLIIKGISSEKKFNIKSWYEYKNEAADKTDACYHGGLVGKLGNGTKNSAVYMKAENIVLNVIHPFAGKVDEGFGFGGIVSYLNSSSVLCLSGTIEVETTGSDDYSDPKIWQGGGIIGKAAAGSVAEFTGTTDVTKCHFAATDDDKPGQLVGAQENALVYAKGDGDGEGWTYKRSQYIDNGTALDTVGNYGQIIRLKPDSATDNTKGLPSDFITIDETTHEVSLKTNDNLYDGTTATISDTEDFARLAIAWQTQGYFSACKNITPDSWGDLANASIKLTGDVDLTGTGITGLTRDNGDKDNDKDKNITISDGYIYKGKLEGNGHTITLAIGEIYGCNGTSPAETPGKNTGSVVRHRYQGLFAALGSGADISGLEVAGCINTATQDVNMYMGGIAGRLQGTGDITIDATTTAVDINCLTDTANNKNIYAGGLFGDVAEARTINLGSTAGSESSADAGSTTDSGSTENVDSGIISGRVLTKASLAIPSNKNVYAGGVIGFIPGNKKITVNCNAVTISGSIASNDSEAGTLKAGGLIGWADYGNEVKSINIKDIKIDDENVKADKVTRGAGFLGHKWANTTVNFETPSDPSAYALTIDGDTAINQPDAEAGGLVYRASGKWTVNDRGINIKKASYNAKYLGLLVCRGDADMEEKDPNRQQALYLSLEENWKTAYVIDSTGEGVKVSNTPEVFDEFIAYTTYGSASNRSDTIADNGVNGIISLTTENNEGVAATRECNTYRNQSAYGKKKVNGCSRYYYNLDAIMNNKKSEVGTSDSINTPERLLIWSVWYYAASNLKTYFNKGFGSVSVIGGTSDTARVSFDMTGLSYYPVNLTGNMTVRYAAFKFDNETIEALETVAGNKSTNGTTASHTQHYMMHCGLFYDMTGRDGTETISNISFEGTVGRVNGSSGALCCGTIEGSNTAGTIKYYQLKIENIVLDGFRVTGAKKVGENEAAPALINKIGSYSTVTISDISTSGSGYDDHSNPAGTSLIGYAGDKTATQISVTFSKMVLPDKIYDGTENGGIFTHASFLEAFQYMENGAASIIYNFERKEDWENTDHIHKVTYGYEISKSSQYEDLQKWYYNKDTYGDDTGLVIDDLTTKNNDFSSYLHYVAKGYDASSRYFEIMVNQRVNDLLAGCGTYGHPYVLTSALDMSTVAAYITTMTAKNNWKIQVTADQDTYHNTTGDSTDLVYEYNGSEWRQVQRESENSDTWAEVTGGKTMSNETMHRYILSAYYDIQPGNSKTTESANTVTLKDFEGFGTELYPFRGVITSTKTGVTIELTGKDTPRGLIPYSYGSVVSNLTIRYSGEGKTITYNDTDVPENDNNTDVTYQPKAFWGGVIGCVMGGDNIIDNVEVTMADGFSLTLDGNRNYLIQTGGYVGSVSGGGVIFRNMSGKTGLADTHIKKGAATGAQNVTTAGDIADASGTTNKNIESLYVNPYIGRILDGYAFSEGCVLDNGTKSCPVIQLKSSDKKISTESRNTKGDKTGYVTTIPDAQSLLVFAAIVNSGSASGAGSSGAASATSDTYKGVLSYRGNTEAETGTDYSFGNGQYGKVRNASYKYIGKTEEDAAGDFSLSVADDTKAPGSNTSDSKNVPYLVRAYADDNTFYAAAKSGASENVKLTIKLEADTTYDMTVYGNGYPGISARYLSSAVNTGKDATSEWGASYLRPEVNGFIGNNSTIKTNIHLIEYADDDFHAVSLGGVFNLIRVADMNYRSEDTNYLVSDLNITDSNVTLEYCSGDGTKVSEAAEDSFPYDKGRYCVNVGGFAGNTSQNGIRSDNKADAKVATGYVFSNITITDSTITGPNCAGGLMGSTGMGDDSVKEGSGLMFYNYQITSSVDQIWNSAGVNLVNCTYSGINVNAGYVAGGFVGNVASSKSKWKDIASDYSWSSTVSSLSVTDNKKTAVGSNSTITASQNDMTGGAGGVFGCVSTGLYINDPEFEIKDIYSNKASGNSEDSGNNESNETNGLYTAKFSGVTVTSKSGDAGGVVGRSGANKCVIRDVSVTGDQKNDLVSATRTGTEDTLHAGGVIGCIRTGEKVLLEECEANKLTVTGNKPGAGGILGGFESCEGSKMRVADCHVANVTVKAVVQHCAVGGLIGHVQGSGANAYFVVDGCSVTDAEIGNSNIVEWNGGLIGSMGTNNNQTLSVYDSSVSNTSVSIQRTNNGGAGGLLCSANGTVYCSNIRLDGIKMSGTNTACFVYNAGNAKILRADGVSIKNSKGDNKNKILGSEKDFDLGSSSYVVLADYTDSAVSEDKAGNKEDELLADNADIASPYVVTSPKSDLAVIDTDKGESARYLHGDGAAWTKSGSDFVTNAQKIWEERNAASEGLFAYTKTGVTDFDFAGKLSTYNKNQTTKVENDFPVLQIAAGDTSCISDYLNILTNGGYRQALSCTNKPVSVKAETYAYDSNSGAFVKSDVKPALQVTDSGTSNITYSVSTDYDNDKDRFTLLTVTFCSDPSTGTKHKYELQIPIIVRRVLEVDFIATLGYGTHFRSTDYDQFTGHVLDSFGNSMTGYLTYVYNSAKGKSTPYGWQEYINVGGDLTEPMDKKIIFRSDLPTGTQLTLVDCQDPNRTSYYYTVTGTKDTEIAFSSFKKSDGSTAFAKESIGECMSVAVTEADDGAFIEVDKDGTPIDGEASENPAKPTVVKDGRYYRLASDSEKNLKYYNVTIDEKNTQENYYLVVTMPKTDEMSYVNGYIYTKLDVGISHNINYMERDMKTVDKHSNTASTYLISDGYKQTLEETLTAVSSSKILNASDSTIKVSVRDTITFPNDQAYNENDQLYQRFSGSLQTSIKADDGSNSINYEPFPSGTAGKARFYVYTIKNGVYTYYSYDEKQNKWDSGQTEKQTAVEYTWISTGGNMDLPLSTDGTIDHAISLQQLRDKVKTSSETGTTSTFYIEAVLDAVIPASGLSVIPVSTLVDGVPQSYAKLNYIAQLSTEKASLSYSSTKETLTDTRVKYYQENLQGAELTYDADDIDQLGINLLDLQNNLDKDQKNAIIGTTARLDLSAMQNLESVLRSSSGIRFNMTLSQKSTTQQETYDDPLKDASEYMTMKLVSPDSGTVSYKDGVWTWTIPASSYLEGDKLKTGVIFDGSAFTQAVNLLVNVENVEAAEHFYANYKVDLTAEILGADGTVEISDTDNVIYTLTKIKPEFESK